MRAFHRGAPLVKEDSRIVWKSGQQEFNVLDCRLEADRSGHVRSESTPALPSCSDRERSTVKCKRLGQVVVSFLKTFQVPESRTTYRVASAEVVVQADALKSLL